MAVYFFALHAYRSWRPDHRRGYSRRGQGVVLPDPEMAAKYDARATQDPVNFSREMQNVIIAGALDVCERRKWRLHGVGFEVNHVHLLVSWREFVEWDFVREKLRTLLSLFLGRLVGEQGRRWFVAGGSRKRVTTTSHFNYLIEKYIPDHSQQKWFEGEPLPNIAAEILDPRKDY